MKERIKDIIAISLIILLIINIITGVIIISVNAKKGSILSTGVSAIVGNVGVVDIKGPIFSSDDDFFTSYANADKIAEKIKIFSDTPTIKAIRLDITSPGGSVSAAETIVSALDYAKSKNKKVVVFMKELATSGAYYVSAPADYIISSRGTIIGNIGVIVQLANIKELLNKIGLKFYTFKSGEYKDILSPYRDISESEKKLIQRIIDIYYNRFIEVILKYRGDKIKKSELLKIADGRILVEDDALSYNLIDEIGNETSIEEVLKKLTGEKSITYVRLPEKKSILLDLIKSKINSIFFTSMEYNRSIKVLYLTY
ncbi:MAG: signal peptide peptidase SppA [Brevinematia bacterium]